MKRLTCMKRQDWTELVNQQGLVYTVDDVPENPFHHYWREGGYYSITMAEYETLKEAAEAVFAMYVEAGDHLVMKPELMIKMGIPEWAHQLIIDRWNDEPAFGSIYGRFDFRFGGLDHRVESMRIPKLYEFNADTPTGLVESTAIQWQWHENLRMGPDQWNFAFEAMTAAWARNMPLIEEHCGFTEKPVVHFAFGDGQGSFEDEMNTALIMHACQQAGYSTKLIHMERVRLNEEDGTFYDDEGDHIDVIFKLYPWEWMIHQDNGKAAFEDMARGGTFWIESPYKMLWSNKATLAILWELFQDDPRSKYLLPTYFADEDHPAMPWGYAKKPFLSREGADITLHNGDGSVIESGKVEGYGEEGFILQELAEPPIFQCPEHGNVQPVIGIWMIDGEPEGILIRETKGSITDDFANFVPHVISDGELVGAHKPVPFE